MIAPPKNKANRYTLISSAVLGSVIAISGIQHGYFEVLQGDKSTENFIIQSIAPAHQRWLNGEETFTLIGNFLYTGIAAIVISIAIMIWSLGFMHKVAGPPIFLTLYIALTLVGGGIIHVLFFLPVWLYSTRIRKELSWRKGPPGSGAMKFWSISWPVLLILTSLLFVSALEISFLGLKNLSDEQIMIAVWSQTLLCLITLNLTFFAAINRDIYEGKKLAFAK